MSIAKQRIHPTWHVTAGCIGFVTGVACVRFTGSVSLLFLAVGILALSLSLIGERGWMVLLALIGGIGIGVWRGGLESSGLGVYRPYIGKNITLRGTIAGDPQTARGEAQSFAVSGVELSGRPVSGTVYVTATVHQSLRRGDMVTLKAKMVPGKGTYAASMYDANVVAINRPKNVFLDARDAFSAAFRRVVQEPMVSLGIGFLVGQKSDLPQDFSDALKVAGLTHVVVASGYNLTILVRFVRRLFVKISKYQAALWSVIMIVSFMAITGLSASMTRAGIVAGLSLLAWYYGRKFHPVTLLVLVGAITTAYNPAYVWGDVSWALSFAAFAGVIIIAPLLHTYFYGEQKPNAVAQIILETIAAQLATLPIMLGVFGQFSVIALLSNLLILPFVPLAMLLSFIAGLCSLALPPIAQIVALPASLLLQYMVAVIEWTARFPWAQVKCQLPLWGVALCYAGIIIGAVVLQKITHYNLRQVNVVE